MLGVGRQPSQRCLFPMRQCRGSRSSRNWRRLSVCRRPTNTSLAVHPVRLSDSMSSFFDPQIRRAGRADRCIRAEASARGKVGIASSVRAPTCARACVYFEWRARSTAILLILPSFRKSSPMWHWWAACSSSPAVLLPSYAGTDLTQPAVTCVKFAATGADVVCVHASGRCVCLVVCRCV